MKKFIGMLSLQDAEVLEAEARGARTIVEFGTGGSTMIFAQACSGRVLSIDTKAEWRSRTSSALQRLGVKERVEFCSYDAWPRKRAQLRDVDVIFVDGEWPLRRTFALEAWPILRSGGRMIFHDTRRAKDIANVVAVLGRYYLEIEAVRANAKHAGRTSNTSVLVKKKCEPEVNWYKLEGKAPWAYGLEAHVPESFWR